MSVEQVEEYYIYLTGISKDKSKKLIAYLSEENHDFELLDGELTVDGLFSEIEALDLEKEILNLLGE